MTLNQIFKLLDAGYTKADIEALDKQDPPKQDPSKQDPPKQDPPKQDPSKQDPPKQDPSKQDPSKQDPPKHEENPEFKALMSAIRGLTKAVQDNNISTASHSGDGVSAAEAADAACAYILDPYRDTKEVK